jgi:hypothetical protein
MAPDASAVTEAAMGPADGPPPAEATSGVATMSVSVSVSAALSVCLMGLALV